MEKIIKLTLLATSLSMMMLYPIGNLIIILPSTPLLYPLNYLQTLGIDANFVLGFLIAIIFLKILSIPQRYPFGMGFIFLILGLFSYIAFQVYKFEISLYAFNHRNENPYNIKYLIEFIIFLFNFIGLILVYRSNLPKSIELECQQQITNE
ncbi:MULTISPECIES: hypothetical protein [Acinetobacter]|uniref:hypothetical protein n=1 Tax=Acinetobacter TaxID=469 RepID=UPI000235E1FF|nr:MULTISPECIES: hypothetical protein [Acinetobacter]KXZ63571.1 hypothetical protein AVENLUH7437_02526 [Acinetobacter venetianus]QNH51215.1 hypothetical protein HWI77_16835 [Acinetobacter venetianus]RZG78345.1 hypothetical protein EXE23_16040 [Acinetobacter venetianus]GAB02235.1 hypothetical protein ACT4_026_00420 [Acinetobacter sp. NBRC 100985]